MQNTLKPIFYQSLIMTANILTGIIITRSSDYDLRADISSLMALLGFSLILLNQSHFEKIIRDKLDFTGISFFRHALPILVLSSFTTYTLNLTFWLFPLVFFYLLLNTIVQLRGAKFFKSNGNLNFLMLSLVFYITNLILTLFLILINYLNIYTWLFTSIVADFILLQLYFFYSKPMKSIPFRTASENRIKFSIAAVFFALADPIIVIIAKYFSDAAGLAYFVVAISTISPILIIYSAFQNKLLTFPKIVKFRFKALQVSCVMLVLILSATFYANVIKYAIPFIFGEKYSQLSNYTISIVVMGYLMLAFKTSNTILRSLDLNFLSFSLTATFLMSFVLCCVLMPNSNVSLIFSTVFSLTVSLALHGIGLIFRVTFKHLYMNKST
jgi:O-antigen/teichoic acid export membrane protein